MDLERLKEMVKRRQEQIDARKTNAQLAKIPAGTSRWRILPGWRKEDPYTYYHDFGQHWIKNADGKVAAVLVSEGKTFGRPDPIEDLVWGAYRATNDKAIRERIKELTAKNVVLVNAVQMTGANADPTKVVLLGLPNGLATKFHETFSQRLEFGINMLDLEKGRDIVITKSGTGFSTEYSMVDAPVETAVDASLMTQVINIDAFIASEREKGLQKAGVTEMINEALARAITGNATGGRASLMDVTPPAAAAIAAAAPQAATLPPPAPVAPLATVAPVAATVAAPVVAAAVVPPGAPVTDSEIIEDAELAKLLGALS